MEDPDLTAADRAALLGLARRAIEAALAGRPAPDLPNVPGARLHRGAFVTLEEQGALRGCIGRIVGDRPLGEVIRSVAVSAACDDPRFPAVAPAELPALRIEISVLGEPVRREPMDLPGGQGGGGREGFVIGRHGLVVRRARAVGVLLPQVATQQGLDPAGFLGAACRKANLPPHSWREPGTEVFTFQADVFGETVAEGGGTADG
ncbi:MAG: AmmeMemoRadiSam system protein A [Gemmatimonadales bacterium]